MSEQIKMNGLMAINSEDGNHGDILGKFLYYSFPKLLIRRETLKTICDRLQFPVDIKEKISLSDAFRSATGDLYDRIVDRSDGNINICRIYCRDNKRIDPEIISRELVEETLGTTTNRYRKLANLQLDKETGDMRMLDVVSCSDRDVYGYGDTAKELFGLYQSCVLNRRIETLAEKYIGNMNAIKISARGHHFFVPKSHMHMVDLLEDFMDELSANNLFTSINPKMASSISINSMYVVDDEKQRRKMAAEFYIDMGKQIEEYQERIEHLIKSGSESTAILNRWLLKVEGLEQKKKSYEDILKQNLQGIDEEFGVLRTLCSEYKLRVNAKNPYSAAFAA